jgi:multidrug efflux pump subunit AcrB
MLVDDATVVVENVNRNLALRAKTGKRKIEAILDSIKEVELGVILSTITRLLAFGAMFFVTGMMGLYM